MCVAVFNERIFLFSVYFVPYTAWHKNTSNTTFVRAAIIQGSCWSKSRVGFIHQELRPPVSALSVLSDRCLVIDKHFGWWRNVLNAPTQKLTAVINNACKRAKMTRARNFQPRQLLESLCISKSKKMVGQRLVLFEYHLGCQCSSSIPVLPALIASLRALWLHPRLCPGQKRCLLYSSWLTALAITSFERLRCRHG